MKFQGIYTPVITPFNADGSIDFSGWAQVLDNQIENGVHGIIVGGSTGEFYALSKAERLEQFKFANEHIAGRVPWIAGINEVRVSEVYDYARQAREAGASAMLVAAPPYSLPDSEELAAHIKRIDEAANLPIMLYNYPGRTGVEMNAEFLDQLADCKNLAAIKESSGELSRIHQLTLEYPNIQLSAGAEDQVLEFFVWGAQSWVCACANIFPKACVAFYESCVVEKDFAKGQQFMATLMPVMSLLEQSGKFIQCVKHGAHLQGLPTGPSQLPMLPLSAEMQAEVEQVIGEARTKLDALMA